MKTWYNLSMKIQVDEPILPGDLPAGAEEKVAIAVVQALGIEGARVACVMFHAVRHDELGGLDDSPAIEVDNR